MTAVGFSPIDVGAIGENIRKRRIAKGLTLKKLSTLSGVSIATISKIENGKISGGFETIYKIARGLGVLVTEIMDADLRATETLIVHKGNRDDIHPTGIYDYYPQAHRNNGALNPYLMTIQTRGVPEKRDWSIHEGEEVIMVLSGTIELHIDGRDPCRLEAGDSACFDSGVRHAFVCLSQEASRIVSVSTLAPTIRAKSRRVIS